MAAIDDIYKPYDYSSLRFFVIALNVKGPGLTKIDEKIPGYVQKLKGVFVSVGCSTSAGKITGYVTMNFNGSAIKVLQLPITRTNLLKDCSRSLPLNETIRPNSLLQGYYYDATNGSAGYPYSVSIYLDYEPIKEPIETPKP
ncbi:MAG: hypothetical protein ACXVPQ_12175 [Bacteroidia bacterium]